MLIIVVFWISVNKVNYRIFIFVVSKYIEDVLHPILEASILTFTFLLVFVLVHESAP
jgi:hypothetical protein